MHPELHYNLVRTDNSLWHAEDVLEINPHDAELRGVKDGDWVKLASRSGEALRQSSAKRALFGPTTVRVFLRELRRRLLRAIGMPGRLPEGH